MSAPVLLSLCAVLALGTAHAQAAGGDWLLTTLPSGRDATDVVALDLDGDARLDLITTNGDDNVVVVLRGDAWGGFEVETHPVGGRPIALGVADLDADGVLDIAVANDFGSSFSVLLGDGAESFRPAVDVPVGGQVGRLAVGDVDEDGLLDLVVTRRFDALVTLFLGTGGGAFSPGVDVGVWDEPIDVALLDVDDDGHIDMLVSDNDAGALAVMCGDGQAGFAPATWLGDNICPASITIGDVDLDGRADVVVGSTWSAELMVFRDDPAGTLLPGEPVTAGETVSQHPLGAAIADVDGDGLPDLLARIDSANDVGRGLAFLRGDGTGGFAQPERWVFGHTPLALIADDVDCDGFVDAVIATTFGLTWLAGEGDGTFPELGLGATAGLDPRRFDVGDIDGDGHADVVVPNYYESEVGVLLGDGTGQLSFHGFAACGEPLQPRVVRLADLDADSDLDLVISGVGTVIKLNDGTGVFTWHQEFTLGSGDLEIVDVNGDGRLDLVFPGALGLGDGTGGVQVVLFPVPGEYAVEVGDMDGDGLPDAVMSGPSSDAVTIVFADSSTSPFVAPVIADPHGLALGDFDLDGVLDIAVSQHNAFTPNLEAQVQVLHGDGNGGVRDSDVVTLGGSLRDAAAADLDQDGFVDLVFADQRGGGHVVWPGRAGGFGTPTRHLGAPAHFLRIADMNGDDRLDVVTVGEVGYGRIAVSLHQPGDSTWPVPAHVAGAAGAPLLKVQALDAPGAITTLAIKNAAPLAQVVLVAGGAVVSLPFAGGVLVPTLDVLIAGIVTDDAGALTLPGSWVSNLPTGTALWLQAWIVDASGPQGWAATDGVAVVVP